MGINNKKFNANKYRVISYICMYVKCKQRACMCNKLFVLFPPDLEKKDSNRHKESLRQAFLVRQQMKSWAQHHTEGQ